VLVIMNAVYRFSQRISNAGSFFAFVRDSLGVRVGFVTGWLFLAFYPVFVGLDLILFGATLNGIILAHGGPDIPWWLLVAGMLAMFGLMIFKPGRLSEAAAIIGEGDTPQERGLLDA
jgi:amino acid transporter